MSAHSIQQVVRLGREVLLASLAAIALAVPAAQAEVSSGTSRDLDAYRAPYQSTTPRGYSLCDVVGIGIAGSNDHVFAWYRDGMVSSGTTTDLARYRAPQPYRLPQGRSPGDVVAMAIAGSNDWVFAWYRDGTVSAGTSTDLSRYRPPARYGLPAGKTPQMIAGIGIAGSNDRVYAWYTDGTVSSGSSTDLGAATPPQAVSNAAGFAAHQIIDMDIAGSDDHVFAWYANCPAAGGQIARVQPGAKPQAGPEQPATTPNLGILPRVLDAQKPRFSVIPDALKAVPKDQSAPAAKPATPDLTVIPKILDSQKKPVFKIIPDATLAPDKLEAGKTLKPGLVPDATTATPGRAAPSAQPWASRLAEVTRDGIGVLNDSMDKLDAITRQGATLRIKRATGGLRPPVDEAPILIDQARKNEALALREEILGKSVPGSALTAPSLEGVGEKPQVFDLFTLPQADALQPGAYIVIVGSGFGNDPGRVSLRYESGSGELTESRVAHVVELDPVNGSWAAAWHDRVVVVRMPDTLPGQMLGGTREAELALVRPNGAQVKLALMLQAGSFPVIHSVTSSSGEIGCCCPIGTETWSRLPESHNYVYWPAPGRLDAPCGLDKKPWLEPGSRIVLTGQRFKEQKDGSLSLEFHDETRPAGVSVKLNVTKWLPDRIEATVVSSPINGYFDTRPAWINLQVGEERANAEQVAFGPEMDARWVSGRDWLKLAWPNLAKIIEAPDGKAMVVTHVPDCGTFGDDGEKGHDEFFGDPAHAFPPDARVTWFRFEQIDPTHPVDEWDVFGLGVEDLASVILDPASLIRLGAEMLINAITLQGEGGYHAYPFFFGNDGNLMGPENSFAIRWETSCEIGDGKPIIYSVSFLIEGPSAALAKY